MAKTKPILWLKRRFNRRFPHYRVCTIGWCLRWQTYEHMCWKHNREYYEKEGC